MPLLVTSTNRGWARNTEDTASTWRLARGHSAPEVTNTKHLLCGSGNLGLAWSPVRLSLRVAMESGILHVYLSTINNCKEKVFLAHTR